MIILGKCSPPPLQLSNHPNFIIPRKFNQHLPFQTQPRFRPNPSLCFAKSGRRDGLKTYDILGRIQEDSDEPGFGGETEDDYEEKEEKEEDEFSPNGRFRGGEKQMDNGYDRNPEFADIIGSLINDPQNARSKEDEFSARGSNRRGEKEMDYDKNPEFAEIIGSLIDDPQKARSKMEERLRRKRNDILHTKTGSSAPMKVIMNNFDFSNSYIWFEFYNAPLEKDVSLICDAIRSWHIVGRLGGCNSLNMQLSQSPMDKRPSYDAIQGANVTPTTFYNIGDLEIQDNLARIWVDIGTREALLLDILINALTQISSDYVGIKKVVFGGSEFENWRENLTSEDAGYSVQKI